MTRCCRHLLSPLLVALALLVPAATATAQLLQTDLDGDGIRDRVDAGIRPSDLVVRLSQSRHPQRLHLREPIVGLATADIDHDGDLDLVAATAHSGLHIWVNEGRGHFSRRPRGPAIRTLPWPRASIGVLRSAPTSGDACDGGTFVLSPLRHAARRLSPCALACQQTFAIPTQLRSRRSAPRGPPVSLSFS